MAGPPRFRQDAGRRELEHLAEDLRVGIELTLVQNLEAGARLRGKQLDPVWQRGLRTAYGAAQRPHFGLPHHEWSTKVKGPVLVELEAFHQDEARHQVLVPFAENEVVVWFHAENRTEGV